MTVMEYDVVLKLAWTLFGVGALLILIGIVVGLYRAADTRHDSDEVDKNSTPAALEYMSDPDTRNRILAIHAIRNKGKTIHDPTELNKAIENTQDNVGNIALRLTQEQLDRALAKAEQRAADSGLFNETHVIVERLKTVRWLYEGMPANVLYVTIPQAWQIMADIEPTVSHENIEYSQG